MSPDNTHFIRVLEVLKASPFLKGIETPELKELLGTMTHEHWPKDTFKNSSDVIKSFHVIICGRLKVYKINPNSGREHTLFILGKGDVFDVMYLMDEDPHDIYWEALDEMEILKIGIVDIRIWISKSPIIQQTLLRYLGKRMRQLEDMATDSSLHSTLVRLSGLLLKNINGKTMHLEVINNLPNEQIASMLGTSRAVVNRHIQELKRCGAITVKRKYINVQNLQTLTAIAEEKYVF